MQAHKIISDDMTCPGCGEILDGATNSTREDVRAPGPGDISLCVYCGSINEFMLNSENNLTLVSMDHNVLEDLKTENPLTYKSLMVMQNHILDNPIKKG